MTPVDFLAQQLQHKKRGSLAWEGQHDCSSPVAISAAQLFPAIFTFRDEIEIDDSRSEIKSSVAKNESLVAGHAAQKSN